MPVKKGERIDPAATRERVLHAAGQLFYARGVHAVAVNDIAFAAGASKLSLYRNFKSKNALVAAVAVQRSERIHAWISRRTAGFPNSVDGVLATFDLLAGWYAEPGFRGCAIVNAAIDTRGDQPPPEESSEETSLTDTVRRHLQRYLDLFVERIAALDTPVSNPTLVARQLLLLIEGATITAAADPASLHTITAAARAAAETLLRAAQA